MCIVYIRHSPLKQRFYLNFLKRLCSLKVLYAREILLTPLPLYDNVKIQLYTHIRNIYSCRPRTYCECVCRSLSGILLLLFKVVELCAVVLTYIFIYQKMFINSYTDTYITLKFKYYIHIFDVHTQHIGRLIFNAQRSKHVPLGQLNLTFILNCAYICVREDV